MEKTKAPLTAARLHATRVAAGLRPAPTALQIDNTKARAKKATQDAEALMRAALALIQQAKADYTAIAKATKKWNHPIEELSDYGRALEEIITSDEGQCGFHTLNK